MAEFILERLRRRFGSAILQTHSQHGNETAVVSSERLVEIAEFLRDDKELAFDMPIDNTAVDWQSERPQRFEVIWHLYSIQKKHRLRLKVEVGGEQPSCPSLTPVWPGMDWHERETWDMYGIHFSNHPNLQRILMYEEFVGHPLRKDYPIDKRQPLIEMRQVAEVATQRQPTPDMLNRP